MTEDTAIRSWFISSEERGNPSTAIDRRRGDALAWTIGNHVELLVHGAVYFRHLHEALCETVRGDAVSFADWRGDPDERLVDRVDLEHVLGEIADRGVQVRGLVWRSHPKLAGFHMEHHVQLAQRLNERGALVLLDQRVLPAGSHHQKLVLIRHGDAWRPDIAFVGGIDLCHGRRDDANHHGDPQPEDLDERYGDRPPWHDIQISVRGPAIGDLDLTFRERWQDPTPLEDRRPLVGTLVDAPVVSNLGGPRWPPSRVATRGPVLSSMRRAGRY